MATREALRLAHDKGLDLVEISPTAKPPVCKIIDFGNYKYQLKKKQHLAKKKQIVIKVREIKFRPMTDEHDYQHKLNHIIRFLREGDKAKVTIMFRGREMAYTDRGRAILDRVAREVEEVGMIEHSAQLEGRNLSMIVAPKKEKGSSGGGAEKKKVIVNRDPSARSFTDVQDDLRSPKKDDNE